MFLGGEREGIRCESELLGIVEAEEEVGDGGARVIDDLETLGALATQLENLGLDRHHVRSHASVKLKRIL